MSLFGSIVVGTDGSDTAGKAVEREPDLKVALPAMRERHRDADALFAWMTDTVPAAVLRGEDLPTRDGSRR